MRNTFAKTLEELASRDPRIMLVTGDLGFSVFESFRKRCPRQYLNAGVAEQHLVGLAAGLAMSGKIPFVYSIIPFATMRCFEQIRDDVCLQNVNVKIVGVGSGYSYGLLGPTHEPLEDIALMRSLPHMRVVCPGDPTESEAATVMLSRLKGPMYLRLGKNGEPLFHKKPLPMKPGASYVLRNGNDAALLSCGNILEEVMGAADILKKRGVAARVVSMPWVKPLDMKTVHKAVREAKAVFAVEEHGVYGGFGSAVAEVIAELPKKRAQFLRIAAPDDFFPFAGSQKYLRKRAGLDAASIAKRVLNTL